MSYQVPTSKGSDDLATFRSTPLSPAPEDITMGDTRPTEGAPATQAVSQEQLCQLLGELQGLRQQNEQLQAQLQTAHAGPTVP